MAKYLLIAKRIHSLLSKYSTNTTQEASSWLTTITKYQKTSDNHCQKLVVNNRQRSVQLIIAEHVYDLAHTLHMHAC